MRRFASLCPDDQDHLFSKDFCHPLDEDQRELKPLPPLPIPRNHEVDIHRASKLLNTSNNTVFRMIDAGLIGGYKVLGHQRSAKSKYRIDYWSIVRHCDNLRMANHLPPRVASRSGMRPADRDVLPFTPVQTLSIQEVAEHLDVSYNVVTRLIEQGDLYGYQLIAGSPWRIHRPTFVDYLNRLQRKVSETTSSSNPR
jgi:excisionase family DNA binding protein